ncbi:RNA-binding transcriptional accessory protein [Desulfurispirillum indicum]|uniref:Tex family protein n=1 Tax=Desulfurispirillum indicum TaxID=936456 RepID=UPI001CF97774|nr:Tex family protein [Desulfurispirillum indicum]UCZ57281.1 RNA-binding transcriptional accessory protein [Desulfurispirillum indicum]
MATLDTSTIQTIAQALNIKPFQVENCIKLHQEGSTVPFITRYRKEMTGELEEDGVRQVIEQYTYAENLRQRRQEVLESIDSQGKLTPELRASIEGCQRLVDLEDIYLPYRPKRRTRAMAARERGLEPVAMAILNGQNTDQTFLQGFVNAELEVPDTESVLAGALDIIAEMIAEEAAVRKFVRRELWNSGTLECKKRRLADENSAYTMYYEYSEHLRDIPPHRILAMNRAEAEDCIRIKLSCDLDALGKSILAMWQRRYPEASTTMTDLALHDALKRLIIPSLETELRSEKTQQAHEHAIKVFGENLKNLLLSPPVKVGAIMGIDPAFRTGCKVVVLNGNGDLLCHDTVYPVPPRSDVSGARKTLAAMVQKHNVELIAIGNGTASAETEEFISDFISELFPAIKYLIVNEAGASVYSVSAVAQEEFPDYDATVRGAVSIARRVLDPLAELVKIDPQSIGVGQYQHDLNQGFLATKLQEVVESAVNYVGVNLNTASASLLRFVSGVNATVARNIVEYRRQIGQFRSRQQLLDVPRLGPQTFVQCAGFIRIPESENFLDNTGVHPESYPIASKLLERFNLTFQTAQLKLGSVVGGSLEKVARELECGIPTLRDIVGDITKPGRDPRSEMEKPILRSSKLNLEEIEAGQVFEGVVRNVVDFGAFVDIGLKNDGLVHISELADTFVKNPHEVVSVGNRVRVRVLSIDKSRGRLSLSMKTRP